MLDPCGGAKAPVIWQHRLSPCQRAEGTPSLPRMQAREAATQHAEPAARHRVAVLGASGYTGEEVVRLMALHPNFAVAALTGESQAGKVPP